MKYIQAIFLFLGFIILTLSCGRTEGGKETETPEKKQVAEKTDDEIISFHIIDPHKQDLRLFWKNKQGENYSNFNKLKQELEEENLELVFATNGGMFTKERKPLGLYIENGKILGKLNTTKEAYGNFYLQPNGILSISKDGIPRISTTTDYEGKDDYYATQSGPMLVVNGGIHPKFNKESTSTHIRNGVGILPNGNLIFAISKKRINFHAFASFFLEKGCNKALYLDGFVSRMYLPSKDWYQKDGNFGVIIGEVKPRN